MQTLISQSKAQSICVYFYYLLVVILISSCSPAMYDFELAEITPPPQPLFERLPLSELVYYGEDFSHYTTTHKNTNNEVTRAINLGSFNTELLSFVDKTFVKEKISSLGIELLLYVEGRTRWDQVNGSGGCFAGPGAAGCFGYISSDKETVMSTTVADLKKSEFLDGSQIISKGILAVPMLILPIPIPIGLYTESK